MLRLILLSLSSFLYVSSVSATLNYETYRGTGNYPTFPGNGGSLYYSSTLSTGTVSSINHNWGGGYVLDSGRYDDVMVHYSGYITVPSTGSQNIKFYLYADDGVYMKVNDTLVINDWNLQGSYTWNYISTNQTLVGGETYSIDAWMYERGGGAAFKLYWDQSGSVALVPSSAYSTTPPAVATPTPIYSSGMSSTQTTRVNSAISDSTTGGEGHKVTATIDGNTNDIYIEQAGEANYLLLSVTGGLNAVDIKQDATTSASYGHFVEVTIDGDSNSLDILQSGSGHKSAFVDINGNNNTADVTQKDGGGHYLQLDLIGDGHDATIIQEGSGSHAATVELTNAGGAWDFDLTQSGTTNKEYSLPHSMSDSSTTTGTCYVAGGCSLTVLQQD